MADRIFSAPAEAEAEDEVAEAADGRVSRSARI